MSVKSRRLKSLFLERLEGRSMFAAGVLDTTFDVDGMAITNFGPSASSAAVRIDGAKIVVAGTIPGATTTTGTGRRAVTTTDPSDFAVARYLDDGSLDPSFGSGGIASTSFGPNVMDHVADFDIAPDGKYVVVGFTNAAHSVVSGKKTTTVTSYDFAVARFNSNGTLDTTFSGDGKTTFQFGAAGDFDEASSVVIQPDGKIVVGGHFIVIDGSQDRMFALTRFNLDGSVDTTFGIGGKVLTNHSPTSEQLHDLALQTVDGQSYIVAAGRALMGPLSGSSYDMVLVRYQMNGTLDTTFGQTGVVLTDVQGSDNLQAIAIQPDGKIVGVGNSAAGSMVLRYDANGTLDPSFGSAGLSFLTSSAVPMLADVALQPDGKIVVGGTQIYGYYDASPDYRQTMVARFDSSGNLDGSFGNGGIALWDVNPANNSVNDEVAGGGIALQADGKIVLAGAVQPVGATTRTQWAVSRLTGDDVGAAMAGNESWNISDLELMLMLLASDQETADSNE